MPTVGGRHLCDATVPAIGDEATDFWSDPPSRGITVIIVDILGRSERVYFPLGFNQTSVSLDFIREVICCEQKVVILYVYMTPK